jgi:hypothetical protein
MAGEPKNGYPLGCVNETSVFPGEREKDPPAPAAIGVIILDLDLSEGRTLLI